MLVEIWSDYACPFCYIGKRIFDTALAQFEHKDEVQVIYKSFELDPDAPKVVDYDVHDMLAAKYNMSREQAIEMNQNVTEQAGMVGLKYKMDSIQLTNTFDAHRLTHMAIKYGNANAVVESLYRAYFTKSLNISDHQTLMELAVDAGMHLREVENMLSTNQFAEQVRADEEEAVKLGIRGVPFFLFGRKYGVSGVHNSNVFTEVLEKTWSEQH